MNPKFNSVDEFVDFLQENLDIDHLLSEKGFVDKDGNEMEFLNWVDFHFDQGFRYKEEIIFFSDGIDEVEDPFFIQVFSFGKIREVYPRVELEFYEGHFDGFESDVEEKYVNCEFDLN